MPCKVKVIIFCAIETEFQENLAIMSKPKIHKESAIGKIGDVTCLLYRSGIGALATQRAVLKLVPKFKPKLIIYSGIAGSRNSNIKIGDVVVSGFACDLNSIYFSPNGELESYTAVQLKRGSNYIDSVIIPGYKHLCNEAAKYGGIIGVVGSCSFYTNNEKWINPLNHVYHVDVEENEGIGFAYSAISLRIPFLIIRGISNSVYQINQDSDITGAKAAASLLSKIINKSILKKRKERIAIDNLNPISYVKFNNYTTIFTPVFMAPPHLIPPPKQS